MGDACWLTNYTYTSLEYNLRSINTSYEKWSLWSRENIPACFRTFCCRLRLDIFDFRSLPAADCGACGEISKASNIWHDSAGCGIFSGWLFGAGETVRSHSGALNCSNVTTQKKVRKTYGDGDSPVTKKDFSLWYLKFWNLIGSHGKGKKCLDSTGSFLLYMNFQQ